MFVFWLLLGQSFTARPRRRRPALLVCARPCANRAGLNRRRPACTCSIIMSSSKFLIRFLLWPRGDEAKSVNRCSRGARGALRSLAAAAYARLTRTPGTQFKLGPPTSTPPLCFTHTHLHAHAHMIVKKKEKFHPLCCHFTTLPSSLSCCITGSSALSFLDL